ncbi:hypothetical protein KAR10_07405, partial [bacterium]|nr:hypothetical protein [bacterium]
NSNNSIPPDIPVELVVTDPRGSEYQRATGRYNANGVVSFEIDFPLYALTGQYYLVLKQKNKEIGKTSLKVEEFIPDKLKVKVKVSRKRVAANEALEFEVQARQMFGPPAAHNKVVTKVVFYSRIFSHPKYKKYTFADHTRSFWDEEVELGEEQLDEQGKNPYYVEIPGLTPPSALKAYIYTEVFDSGGRPVSAVGFADIDLYTHYLGVKRKGQGPMFEKKGIKLNYVAIDAQGRKQKVRKVRLIIKRKAWYSIFRHGSWGHSSYDSASYEELITNKVIDIKGKGEFEFIPKAAGEYQVLLISPNGMQTRITLDVMGTGYATTNLESPENLKISLDKKKYAVGEQAQVLVHAPFPGKLFLTIEREKVYQTRIIPITGRKAAVSIPITGEYLPNMYVVGLLVRTPDEKMQTLPMVSYGIEPLYVKTASKQIRFEWDVAKTSKAQEGIDVSLQVGSRPGGTNVILAAVDEGALQITNFKTPDPLKYFYRKRSLDTRAYTFFKLILPNLFKRKFAIGGGEGDITRRHLNPVTAKKKKTLALYSGILTPDSNGRIQYHFDTPEFNGEVRVMAMAVQGDYYGSDARAIQVFDPIVLQPNYPPFLAPQDQFQIPIQIFNKTGKKTKITLRISAEGPITITDKSPVREFVLGKEKQKRVIYQARANNNAGVGKVKIVAQGAGHEIFRKREISIRPYNTLKTVVKHGTLKPEAAVDIQVPAGFIPFGQRIRFGISSNPLFKYMRSLEYLIQYPYGCAEQIASKVFPLIYFKELGFATGRFSGQANAVDVFIRVGIDKLEKLQLADGNFAMWPGGSAAGKWLNMYISHFLIEADNMGYAVKAKVLKRIKQNVLKGKLTHKKLGRLDRRDHVPEKQEAVDAYLLYLRALLNEPDVEGMVFLLNKKLDKLGEFDRAMLSMCYSRIGDQQTALKVLKPDFKSKFIYREQYGAFNSTVRNTAMYLSALALAKPDSKRIPKLINYLGSKMKDGHFGSTQENVWAFMALGRVYGVKSKIVKTDIWVDDQPYKMLAGQDLIHTDNQLSGKKITLKNLSQQKSFYYFLAEGTPLEKVAQTTSNGMKISRSFYNSSGKSVNLTNVPQGELVAVTIKVTADKEAVRNVIVVELLPGGFEIENPRLSSRGELGFDPRQSMAYDYQDIRDDRILLFVNQLAGTKCYSYTVRAVTPGRYVIPNAYAEAMYDPDINAEYYEPKFLVISDNNPGE